jgi:ZIP family zinc transporter
MAEAAVWGLLAGSSLVLGAVIAILVRPSQHSNGLVMAFGAGVLISAIAYELVAEAIGTGVALGWVALGLGAGALAFYLGDLAIDRAGGEHRKGSAAPRPGAPRSRSRSGRCWTASPSRSCSGCRS